MLYPAYHGAPVFRAGMADYYEGPWALLEMLDEKRRQKDAVLDSQAKHHAAALQRLDDKPVDFDLIAEEKHAAFEFPPEPPKPPRTRKQHPPAHHWRPSSKAATAEDFAHLDEHSESWQRHIAGLRIVDVAMLLRKGTYFAAGILRAARERWPRND